MEKPPSPDTSAIVVSIPIKRIMEFSADSTSWLYRRFGIREPELSKSAPPEKGVSSEPAPINAMKPIDDEDDDDEEETSKMIQPNPQTLEEDKHDQSPLDVADKPNNIETETEKIMDYIKDNPMTYKQFIDLMEIYRGTREKAEKKNKNKKDVGGTRNEVSPLNLKRENHTISVPVKKRIRNSHKLSGSNIHNYPSTMRYHAPPQAHSEMVYRNPMPNFAWRHPPCRHVRENLWNPIPQEHFNQYRVAAGINPAQFYYEQNLANDGPGQAGVCPMSPMGGETPENIWPNLHEHLPF